MPLFRSLRSKSSLKSSSASILSDKDGDFGPRSPSQTTYSSVKKNDFGTLGRKRSSNKAQNVVNEKAANLNKSPSAASFRSTQSYSQTASQQQQTSLMSALSSVPSDLASSNKPRPSELFAGKGVQWDSVKLAGPGAAPALQTKSASSTNEDLQAFLKQRRQWKPTFVTEESTPRVNAPTDLKKLTFMSQDSGLNTQGLMSFEDLDKSHQRKQQLLSDNPSGGTNLWDEAESSKAGQQRAAAAALNEVPQRRASNFKPGRKNVPLAGQQDVPTNVPQTPSRSTSAAHLQGDISVMTKASSTDTSVGAASNDRELSRMPPPPIPVRRNPGKDAKLTTTAPANAEVLTPIVRQSSETTGNFVTPNSSRPQSSQDILATTTPANPSAAGAVDPADAVQSALATASQANGNVPRMAKSDVPATVPEEPATPQAPVASL